MKEKSSLRREFYEKGRFAGIDVYDMHGHMHNWYGSHLPATDVCSMVRHMDRAGVKMLAFCSHAALMCPDIGNRLNVESVKQYPDRLRAYCGINPNYPERIKEDLISFDKYREQNIYAGFKCLSSYHGFPLTDSIYMPMWDFAEERGLPVLLHTWGGDVFNGPGLVRRIAEKYSGVKILMGHSCHGEWDKAIELANDFPNIYLELCAVLDERGILEKMVGESDPNRILFGTDLPWFGYNYYIGAVLGADISDCDREKILSLNAKNLLGIS